MLNNKIKCLDTLIYFSKLCFHEEMSVFLYMNLFSCYLNNDR